MIRQIELLAELLEVDLGFEPGEHDENPIFLARGTEDSVIFAQADEVGISIAIVGPEGFEATRLRRRSALQLAAFIMNAREQVERSVSAKPLTQQTSSRVSEPLTPSGSGERE